MNYLKFRGRSYSRFLLQTLLCSFLFLLLYSCNDQDEYAPLVAEHDHSGKSKSQYVSTESIPEIMDFINEASSGTGKFLLRSEDLAKNLSLDSVEIIADEALQVTNDYDLSNYTFKTKVVSEDKSVVQLVVKSTSWGEYGFFIQFKPSTEYLRNFTELDFFTYDGVVLIYDLDGEYIGSKTYSNGTPTSYEVVEECVVSDQGDGSDTGGGTGDGADTGDTGDTGTTGDPGGITDNSNITISVGCCNRNRCDVHGPRLPEPLCTGSFTIIDVTNKSGNNPLTESCVPCDVDCVNGHDDFCACLPDPDDDTNENPDTGLIPELMFMLALDEFVELTEEQKDWIWDHPNNRDFAYAALEAFQNGGFADFEEKIILEAGFANHTRLNYIYNKVNSGTNTISQYLTNFTGETPVSHLRFSTDDNFAITFPELTETTGAATLPPQEYLIDIVFNTDISLPGSDHYQPKIILAVYFLHEVIHAEIYRKLMSVSGNPNVNFQNYSDEEWINFMVSLRNEFPGVWDYYLRFEVNTPNPSDSHHEAMAQHYISIMAQALSEYDDNQHDTEFYEALSWLGLRRTRAWDLLTSAERMNIEAIISNAIANEPFD